MSEDTKPAENPASVDPFVMRQVEFPNGLTVQEFKRIVADWPEFTPGGEPCEVWIETGKNLTSVVSGVEILNKRNNSGDLLLHSDAFI